MYESIRKYFGTPPKQVNSALGAGSSGEDDNSAISTFQSAWKDGALVEDLFGAESINLHGSVGARGAENHRSDVAKVETLLGDAGFYKPMTNLGPNGWHNPNLDSAIREFQKSKGLQVDGFLKPSGPTINALSMIVPRQPKGKNRPPLADCLEPRELETDQIFQQPKTTIWDLIFKDHSISAQGAKEHDDWANRLSNDSNPTETARLLGLAVKNHGNQGIADVADLLGRFSKQDQAKAEGLRKLVCDQTGQEIPLRIAPLGEGFKEQSMDEKIASAPKSPFGTAKGADQEAAASMAKALLKVGDYKDAYGYLKSAPEATPAYMAAVHEFIHQQNPELALKFAEQGAEYGMTKSGAFNDLTASSLPRNSDNLLRVGNIDKIKVAANQNETEDKGEIYLPPIIVHSDEANTDYGAIASEFNLSRSVGENAGPKTKEALDAMLAFRDGSDRSNAALNKVMGAAHLAASENPKAAHDIRMMLLDSKTNPIWQPRVMSDQQLEAQGAGSKLKRFTNLGSLSSGTANAAGAVLEAAGHKGPGKAAAGLALGASIPMAGVAAIDQVRREALKDEEERRGGLKEGSPRGQLDIDPKLDISGAEKAMSSMLAIRDADVKRDAVEVALKDVSELKAINPEAAAVLQGKLDSYISNPANVPALLKMDEVPLFLGQGSDAENYLTIATTGLDLGALMAGGGLLPFLTAPVTAAAIGTAAMQGWAQYKAEKEQERRSANADNGRGASQP